MAVLMGACTYKNGASQIIVTDINSIWFVNTHEHKLAIDSTTAVQHVTPYCLQIPLNDYYR